MKKVYESPTCEVLITSADIIVTSGSESTKLQSFTSGSGSSDSFNNLFK